eukprot:200966_1
MAAEKKTRSNIDINVTTQPSHAITNNPINMTSSASTSTRTLRPPPLSTTQPIHNLGAKTAFPSGKNQEKWSCAQCTFLNDSVYFHCSICHTVRPTDTSPLRVIQEMDEKQSMSIQPILLEKGWQCSRCTLINEARILLCVACHEPKSVAKPSPNPSNKAINNMSTEEEEEERKSATPPSDNAEHSHHKRVWICSRCGDEMDFEYPYCSRCGTARDKQREMQQIRRRKDWLCDSCQHLNDWTVTQHHAVPCCLKCGAPNLKLSEDCSVDDNDGGDTMPPLEQAGQGFRSLLDELPPLDDWSCVQCGQRNTYHNDRCSYCHQVVALETKSVDIDFDALNAGWNSNGITYRDTDETKVQQNKKKNELQLSETQQQCLVSGFCRLYGGDKLHPAHGLWTQTVLWCFGCYLARDQLSFAEDMLNSYRFYGDVKCKGNYVYSWELRIKTRDTKAIKTMVIGLMNSNSLEIDYAITGNGFKLGQSNNKNNVYCQSLRCGDQVILIYDKKRALLQYVIGHKSYGTAFDQVKCDEEYQLVVRLNGTHIQHDDIQLVKHDWTV